MNYFSFIEDFRQMGMLFEGIDDMRKFYKNIPEDEFISYIELDPTYKQGSNKAGTYAKWILGLANNNNIKDKNHVRDLLKRFEENKKNLKDKDIMKFKSMDELESYLNNDDNYLELSRRQEVRQRQKDRRNADLSKEAELVYEDSDWEVWIPKTYAASCKLGQGTSWCTASTETSEYYDDYTSDGNLYININKHNPKEKYQFHFESESYMDRDDVEIDLEDFFLNNESLYKNYYSEHVSLDIDFEGISEQIKILKQNGGKFVYKGQDIHRLVRDLITNVVIPTGVTTIGVYALGDCPRLTSVEIPNSVTIIGDDAFYKCKNLKEIVIPDSVTSIGPWAFYNCCRLRSVTIPNSVISIGNHAFDGCESLTSVEIGDGVTSIGNFAFQDCNNLIQIKYTGSARQWKQIKKGKDWANGVPSKSVKLVDSVGIDENFKRRNKHIQ